VLPEPRPARVQAPAGAGVGLLFRRRFADPSWPPDWWQRNYDEPVLDPDTPDPEPLSGRQLTIPPAPAAPVVVEVDGFAVEGVEL